ncbi:MAG: prenyltransferase/squalene oxidase repeat-containing protein [Atribacterota bacterium]
MEAFEDIDSYIEENDRDYEYEETKNKFISWGVSLGLHALICMILTMVVLTSHFLNETPPVRVSELYPPETNPFKEDPEIRTLEDPDVKIVPHEEEVTAEETILSKLDVDLPEDITTEDIEDFQDAKGREDAVSDIETGSTEAFMAIGSNSGGAGAFGRVRGGDKKRIGCAFGPNARRASSAIEAALRWLQRHQSINGMWDSDDYFINCKLAGPKCEPGKNVGGADEALTGYALLCYLGAGYDHQIENPYRDTIKKGIQWVLTTQQENGLIGRRNYEHAVCTMALAEAYAMTMDPSLAIPTQKAVDIILQRQTKGDAEDEAYGGYGWNYINGNITRQDQSVSPWCVMALKSAKVSGVDVKNGLHGAKRWLEGAWKAANPNWKQLNDPYTDKSVFPYTWNIQTDATKKDHLSFSGSLCAVFLGYDQNDILLSSLVNDMTERWYDNEKYKNNYYALYYGSLSSFQFGENNWKEKWGNFETGYVPWLLNTQFKTNNCNDGSWPDRNQSWHGGNTSPVLKHVYLTLSLEVAYRYLPLASR